MASLRCGLLVESAWNAFGWVLQESTMSLQRLQQTTRVAAKHRTAV